MESEDRVLGTIGIVTKGEYSADVTYEYLNIVSYNGSSYVLKVEQARGIEPTNTEYWMLSAEKGDKGDNGDGGNGNILTFKNTIVSTSSWIADTTYEEFGYKADITCDDVTADFFSDVVFDVSEATSGNYAPISVTGDGIVTIYAVEAPTADIVIPTIICSKGA